MTLLGCRGEQRKVRVLLHLRMANKTHQYPNRNFRREDHLSTFRPFSCNQTFLFQVSRSLHYASCTTTSSVLHDY